jgi:hypothetical protein
LFVDDELYVLVAIERQLRRRRTAARKLVFTSSTAATALDVTDSN